MANLNLASSSDNTFPTPVILLWQLLHLAEDQRTFVKIDKTGNVKVLDTLSHF